jgi:hypothetical protein
VLAIGPNDLDERFSRPIKIRTTVSFEGKVKPLVACLLILTNSVAPEPEGSSLHSQQLATGPYPEHGMLKNPTSMKEILRRQNSLVITHRVSPASLLMSMLITARELWWTNQK